MRAAASISRTRAARCSSPAPPITSSAIATISAALIPGRSISTQLASQTSGIEGQRKDAPHSCSTTCSQAARSSPISKSMIRCIGRGASHTGRAAPPAPRR